MFVGIEVKCRKGRRRLNGGMDHVPGPGQRWKSIEFKSRTIHEMAQSGSSNRQSPLFADFNASNDVLVLM